MRASKLAVGFAVLAAACVAPAAVSAAEAVEPTAKALRYHKALLRRPQPGYLFDRFFNTWLEAESAESLGAFLEGRQDDSTADGLLLAFFYAKQGEDVRAIARLRETLAGDDGNSLARFEKAKLEARSLNFEVALADLAAAAAADPDEDLALEVAKLRGRLLVRVGKRDEALAAFRELLRDGSDDETAEDLIELLVDEELLDEAAEACEGLIARTKDPYRRVLRRLRLGDIRQRAGERAAAVGLYADLLADVGVETWLEREVLAQIERSFRREEDTSGLKEQYAGLLERYPRRVAVRKGYARVLADFGDADGAIAQFREILAVTPGDRDNQQEFIGLFVRTRKYAEAREQLAKLIALHPDDPELHVQDAELAAELKDAAGVSAAVDRYLETSDGGEYAHLRAARILQQLQQTEAAKAKYTLLVEKFPASRSALESFAAFLFDADEKEAALARWRQAADGGDVQQVVRVAQTLTSRLQQDAAYELLSGRVETFGDDPMFMAAYVDAAAAVKKFDEAVPFARKRVDRADTEAEVDQAVAQAARVIAKAERTVEVLEELSGDDALTPSRACLLAELFEEAGDPQRADETLAPRAEAGDTLAIGQQVRLARRRRDWDAAAAATERLLNLPGGRDSRTIRRLIEFLQRGYRSERALALIPEWKRLSPGNSTPWLTEATLLVGEGKEAEAIEVLRQASRRLDDPRDVRSRLASLYEAAGRLADAERLYWRDYEDAADVAAKVRAVEQLARTAESQGKTATLVANFEERRRDNRESVEPLMALAAIHRVSGDYAKRMQVLGAAATLRPGDVGLLTQIARVQEREGDWEAARDTLRRAAAADPTPKTDRSLARLLIRWGETDEGYAILRALAVEESDDPRDLEAVADAMAGAGDWDRAADFLRDVLADHPDDYRIRYLLGVSYEEQDEASAAVEQMLAILAIEEDTLAKPDGQPAVNPMNGYVEELRKIGPPGFADLLMRSQTVSLAYGYRQQNLRRGAGGFSAGSAVRAPASLESARDYAVTHLGQLIEYLPEDEADVVRAKAVRAEPSADLFLSGAFGDPNNRGNITFDRLGEYADRPELMAWACLQGVHNQSVPNDLFPRAFVSFEREHPQLAIIAGLNAVTRLDVKTRLPGEPARTVVEGVTELMASTERLSVVTYMTALQWLRQRAAAGLGPDDGSGRFSDAVKAWLVESYPKLENASLYGGWISQQYATLLMAGDDPQPFVTHLEAEVARHREQPSRAQKAMNAAFMFGRNGKLLAEPAFPPTRLADVPNSVIVLTRRVDRPGVNYSGLANNAQPGWDDEDLAVASDGVEDTLLRLLLANRAGDEARVERAVEQLLDRDGKSLDVLLLAAGYENSRERPAAALATLAKARFLPMGRATRRQIDGHIVALAIKVLDEAETRDEEVLRLGRESALRLRYGSFAGDQRSELITAMSDLGLDKEAERLDRKTPALTGLVASTARPYVAPSNPDQVKKLIDAGKTDAAVRLLARDLRGVLPSFGMNPSQNRYQRREVRQRIGRYGLVDEVVALFDPGESDSHRKHADYAGALTVFDRAEEAASAYGRALEARPREDGYRIGLIFAEIAAGRRENALARIEELGPRGGPLLVSTAVNSLQDYDATVDTRLDQIEAAAAYLETLAADASAVKATSASTWTGSLVTGVASSFYANNNGGRLPQLYARSTQSRETSSDELAERRRTLHTRIATAMSRIPETACDGFAALHAARVAAGTGDVDGAAELAAATDAVLRYRPARVFGGFPGMVQYGGSQTGVRLVSPVEYVVARAVSSGEADTLDSLRADIEREGHPTVLRAFDDLRALYEVDAAGFVETGRELMTAWRQGRRKPPGADGRAELAVLDCHRVRGLAVDVEPIFTDLLAESRRNSSTLPEGLLEYAAWLAEHRDTDDVVAWFEKVAAASVAAREKRAAFIETHYQTNGSWSWNSPLGRIRAFQQYLTQAVQRPPLTLPVALFLAEGELGPLSAQIVNYLQGRIRVDDPRDADAAMTFLKRTGVLGDRTGRTLFPFDASGGQSLFDIALGAIKGLTRDVKRAVMQRLAKRPDPSLGVILTRASLAPLSDPVPVHDFVEPLLPEFAAMPPARRTAIATELGVLVESFRAKCLQDETAFPDSAAAVARWAADEVSRASEDFAGSVLKKKRFGELGVETHNVDEWLAERLPPVVDVDPAAAAEIYRHVCVLLDDENMRTGRSYSYGSPAVGALLPRLRWYWRQNAGQDSIGLLKLMIAVLRSDEPGGPVAFSGGNVDQQFGVFRERFDRSNGGDADGRVRRVVAFVGTQAEELGDSASLLLFKPFFDRMQNLPRSQLVAISQKLSAEDAPGGTVGRACRLAADLLIETKGSGPGTSGDEQPASCWADLSAALADETIAIGERFSLAAFLQQSVRMQALPASLLHDLSVLATEAVGVGVACDYATEDSMSRIALAMTWKPADRALGDPYLDAWADRYLKTGRTAARADHAPAVLRMTEVMLRRGQVERTVKTVRTYRDGLRRYPGTVLTLARHGQTAEAARFARAHWRDFSIGTPTVPWMFDRLAESAMPALREEIGGPLGYFVELSLSRAADLPSGGSGPPERSRDERVLALAREFDSAGLTDRAMRTDALLLFRDHDEATDLVAGTHIAPLARRIDLASLSRAGSSDFDKPFQLKRQHAGWAARQGDVGPALDLLDELTSERRDNNYRLWNAFYSQSGGLWQDILDALPQLDGEAVAEIAERSRRLVTRCDDDVNAWAKLSTLLIATHTLADAADDYAAWFTSLSPDKQRWFTRRNIRGFDFAPLANTIDSAERGFNERVATTAAFLKICRVSGWLKQIGLEKTTKIFLSADKSKVRYARLFFEPSDLPRSAAAVAVAAPDAAYFVWATEGDRLEGRKAHTEAVEAWETAANAAKIPPARKIQILSRLTRAQIAAGLFEDATATVSLLRECSGDQKRLSNLCKRLRKEIRAARTKADEADASRDADAVKPVDEARRRSEPTALAS